MTETGDRTIGLALSGGSAKSVAHVGVLEALTEAGLAPHYLAGTSGGSIVGSAYAAGLEIDRLKQVCHDLRWTDIARLTVPRLGLLSNCGLQELLDDLLGGVEFADLRIPLSVVATELLTGRKVVIREGSVARAVKASTTIPCIFEPIQVDESYYVDGALVEYLPVETVKEYGPDVVVAVDLGHKKKPRKLTNLLDVSLAVSSIAAQQNRRESRTEADVLIEPRMSRFASTDLCPTRDLVEAGYEAGKDRIGDIQAAMARARPGPLERLRTWSGFFASARGPRRTPSDVEPGAGPGKQSVAPAGKAR